MHTILRSASKEVMVGIDRPFIIIGEKINPTGPQEIGCCADRRKLRLCSPASRKPGGLGGRCFGCERGTPGLDEVAAIRKVIQAVASVVFRPIVPGLRQSGGAGRRSGSCPRQTAGQTRSAVKRSG